MPRLTRSPSAAHSELYTITDPDLDQVFGQEVLGLADLDGDGVRDFAVADSNLVGFGIGRVNVYSGATGAPPAKNSAMHSSIPITITCCATTRPAC